MKNHVWRPLFVVIGVVIAILLFRAVYVPSDFGSQERGYTFGYHRLSNEQEWKDYPEKYKGSDYCNECHEDKTEEVESAHHATIPCENCHGAGKEHAKSGGQKPLANKGWSKEKMCGQCHVQKHSPSFDIEKYWPKIVH